MATNNATRDMLGDWQAMLVPLDRNVIKNMARSGDAHGLDVSKACSTNSFSLCVEGPVKQTPMYS